MIKINGIELEDLNILKADTAEIVEEIINGATTESGRTSKAESFSQMIREQCDFIYDSFDKLFGDGTSEDIFKGEYDLRIALTAFDELVEIIKVKQDEAEKEFAKYNSSKYTPNRAARRTK